MPWARRECRRKSAGARWRRASCRPPAQRAKESHVWLVQALGAAQAEPLTGHARRAPAEGNAAHTRRGVTEILHDLRVNHAGADDGDPARLVTRIAAFAVAAQ